jgi:hypothetical protein
MAWVDRWSAGRRAGGRESRRGV